MLFGEKYGDSVRTIQFGKSIELCGGIHVSTSSKIGHFKILSEGSISSGIRRIEAVTAHKADEYVKKKLVDLEELNKVLKNPDNIVVAVKNLQKKNAELLKIVEQSRRVYLKQIKTQIEESVEVLNDISFMYLDTDLNSDEMKQLSFR